MLITEPVNMEETSKENAKISDSGYSNTCSNSQFHTSSESSEARNSHKSASSGYHGRHPSTFGSCTETLPKPITKRKEKGHKKTPKNSASSATLLKHVEATQIISPVGSAPVPNAASNHVSLIVAEQPCKAVFDKKAEVAVVELVDATDPRVHNDNNSNLLPSSEAGLASKTCPIDEFSSQSTEEYYAAISMHDGLVLHATPSLHASLGYPKDSWTGQLFIDFLDPKDKHVFIERIASEITLSREICQSGANGRKASIFCRLRRFNATSCASGNNDSGKGDTINHSQEQSNRCEQYAPYRIRVVVQNFNRNNDGLPQSQVMILVAFFQPIRSAYKVPEETIIPTVFTTRHNAACRLSYVDPDVVQYLGYLPQDMIDRSLFDFYHPEDLPLIKDIYKTVINLDSSSYRSKPYRYIVQNGCYVVLETDWSSFVNPWSKNLEFIVGYHRVLKGPADPDVFRSCPSDRENGILANIRKEVLQEAKIIEKEILALLSQDPQRKRSYQVTDSELLSKKKELHTFVKNILQEIKSPAPVKDHVVVDDRSFSEHGSVMLGEVSPHHEYFDSKSSTETPPSYNQLNYNDNIQRFFNSNIGASVDNRPYVSDPENLQSSANSSDEHGKKNSSGPELQFTSSSGSGNSGSAENLSSELNNQCSSGSRGDTSNTTSNSTGEACGNSSINANSNNNVAGGEARFKTPILTETLLNLHNGIMEKLLVQKHLEQKKGAKRIKIEQKANKESKEHQQQPTAVVRCERGENKQTRLKRSGSPIWEDGDNFKISKHDGPAKTQQNTGTNQTPTSANFPAPTSMETSTNTNNANLQWPPLSVPMPSATTLLHQYFANPNARFQERLPMFPQMLPVYCLPVLRPQENPSLATAPQEHPGPPNALSPYCYVPITDMATTMSNIIYPPIIRAPALTTMMYQPFIVPETSVKVNAHQPVGPPEPPTPQTATTDTHNNFNPKCPARRPTSVKAEPGSIMALSESSKKTLLTTGIVSSCMSNEGDCSCSCINKSCDSCCNTDRRYTASSSESQVSLNESINQPKQTCHKSKESRVSQMRKVFDMVRKEPPWNVGAKLTPELIYKYQKKSESLDEILKADLDFLRRSKQPNLVNEQLGQLFHDLEIQGLGSKLLLDDAGTNSASDNSSDDSERALHSILTSEIIVEHS
ncbi:period circadian protein isoform X4 [Nasonia vitripennis]|uniref:Period circadian protein n=1 Tax=Nasonia vitripennis TaxID=7425 RepID=A0A7M7H5E9_NASVI|nr:period circadian protein isoform X4 [Nasonia vitripennis]